MDLLTEIENLKLKPDINKKETGKIKTIKRISKRRKRQY